MKTMIKPKTRREFLNDATGFTAATLLATRGIAGVHWPGSDTIQVALVGCGSRGSGAAVDALGVKRGPMRMVAMADVFEGRLKSSHEALTEAIKSGLDVPPDRRSSGSTRTGMPWTASDPVMWSSSRRHRRFAGSISRTQSKGASTSSWKSP
jgi:hypothetical protein